MDWFDVAVTLAGLLFAYSMIMRMFNKSKFEKVIEYEEANTLFVKIDAVYPQGGPAIYLVHGAIDNSFILQTPTLEEIPTRLFTMFNGMNIFFSTQDAKMVALFLPKEST
jgi:hypothetical protein